MKHLLCFVRGAQDDPADRVSLDILAGDRVLGVQMESGRIGLAIDLELSAVVDLRDRLDVWIAAERRREAK